MFCINIGISEFHQHPKYGTPKMNGTIWANVLNYDIAIIVLNTPFKVGFKVTVIGENDKIPNTFFN